MPTLELSDEQVMQLVRQLPREQQQSLLRSLLANQWRAWAELSEAAQAGARVAAQRRGLNWDALSEQEREQFVDDIVHEDRK